MMWRLLGVTSLLSIQALCCIQCNKRGREAMEKLNTFIQDMTAVMKFSEYVTFKSQTNMAQKDIRDFLEKEVRTLDKQAIYDIVEEYKLAVDTIIHVEDKDVQPMHIIQDQFKKLKHKIMFTTLLAEIRRCPNKLEIDNCGLLMQTYTDCKSCEEEKIICAGGPSENQESFDSCSCVCTKNRCLDLKSGRSCRSCRDPPSHLDSTIDCGERSLSVTEDEDVALECSYDWFTRLEEGHKTIYEMATRPDPIESEDPIMQLKEIQVYESGTYVCTTYLNSGVPITRITYKVTVSSGSKRETEEEHHPAPPPLPEYADYAKAEDPRVEGLKVESNKGFIAICVSSTIGAVLITGICIFIFCYRKCAAKKIQEVAPI